MRLTILIPLLALVPVTSFVATAAELTLVEKEIRDTGTALSLQEVTWGFTPALSLTEGKVPEVPEAPTQTSKKYSPKLPEGAKGYTGASWTQSIFVLNDRDVIRPFRIRKMDDRRWHQPGGLEGLTGWRSDKYRTLPQKLRPRYWIGNVTVENGIWTGRYKADGKPQNYEQQNRGMLRQYPDGTRFDEVLVNVALQPEQVFEHRVREKHDGKWLSDIVYRNPKARPEGYQPVSLTQCAGCHTEAGTGKYNDGLVPGGDGVLSDPLPWYLTGQDPEGQEIGRGGSTAPVPPQSKTQTQAQPSSQKTTCGCAGRGNCGCREDQCSCANCGKGPNRVQPQTQTVPRYYFRSAPACLT